MAVDFLHDAERYYSDQAVVPQGGVAVGGIFKVADTWLLAYMTGAAAAVVEGIYIADNVDIPKSTGSGQSIAAFDALWLNTTTKVVSATKGQGDVLVGIAKRAASTSDTTVRGNWNGYLFNQV